MTSVYTQPLGTGDISNDILAYADSTSDIWLFVNTASSITELDIPFPTEPINDQTFGFTTKSAINTLAMTTNKTVVGAVASFQGAGSFAAWTYNESLTTWFRTS